LVVVGLTHKKDFRIEKDKNIGKCGRAAMSGKSVIITN